MHTYLYAENSNYGSGSSTKNCLNFLHVLLFPYFLTIVFVRPSGVRRGGGGGTPPPKGKKEKGEKEGKRERKNEEKRE